MDLRQHCGTQRRRQTVADSSALVGGVAINGIDFLEVLDRDAPTQNLRQRLIDLTFLKPDGVIEAGAPVFQPENVRIAGGSREAGLRVTDVAVGPGDRTLRLTVNRAGDFSPYQLSLHAGPADDAPPGSIDWALSSVTFSFKADCPTNFDCKAPPPAEASPAQDPSLNYLAKDYASFRQLMLDRMAETIPAWTERSPADLGVTLVEALATAADRTSYYQDAVGGEAFLPRARLRTSVLRHGRLLGYQSTEGANARTFVHIRAMADRHQVAPPLIPAGTRFLTSPPELNERLPVALPREPGIVDRAVNNGALVFESMEDLTTLRTAQNSISFHTWSDQDCCLPAGSTVAHVVGSKADLGLAKGDLLLLEELIPPGGSSDDPPDPSHRQVVRLDRDPMAMRDHVTSLDVLELHWSDQDALGFPLNLSGDGGAPGALARGNLVAADHGRTLDFADPVLEDADVARGTGLVDDIAPGAIARSRLAVEPIVYAAPFHPRLERERAAAALLAPTGTTIAQVGLRGGGEMWTARADLLASDRFAPDFKVEPLEGSGGRVRFGDGNHGRAPDPNTRFSARIRVGGGVEGNIGVDAIRHVVSSDPDLFAAVRNPLPAIGGARPESLVAIKISAPRAFRAQKRAVTPSDYAAAAETFPGVQRATAERRHTGSWQTIFLSIDRMGGLPVDPGFETELRRHLAAQRLAGHDLEIVRPIYAALDIQLIVCVGAEYYPADVERELLDSFSSGYTRQGRRGFFHPDHFSFGEPVRLSALIARAMQVAGVLWVGVRLEGAAELGKFQRLDQPDIDHTDAGFIPVGPKEIARLDNDPNAPENGRLGFLTRGGR